MANPDLVKAVLGTSQPGTTPLGSSPEVAKMFSAYAPLAVSNAQGQATGYNDQVAVANQKAAASAAREKALAMADPSKYSQVPKKDGGYSFLDPNGNEISAYAYSRITQQPLNSILKDSQNPVDVGFNQDYGNLDKYIQAKLQTHGKGANPKAVETAKAIEDTVRQQFGVDLAKMDVQEVYKRFQQAYPTVFGLHKPGVNVGRTFIPDSGSSNAGGYGLGAPTAIPGG